MRNYRGNANTIPRDFDNFFAYATYDPTNGTVSKGDVLYWQGAGLIH